MCIRDSRLIKALLRVQWLVKRFFSFHFGQRGQPGETCRDAIQCQTEEVTLVRLGNINSHSFTCFLELTQRRVCAQMHTHFKCDFDQSSAILLELHPAGFYGNSRLGLGILWCSIPVMQTDEWTVCSFCRLFKTQPSLGQGMTGACGGVTATAGVVCYSG